MNVADGLLSCSIPLGLRPLPLIWTCHRADKPYHSCGGSVCGKKTPSNSTADEPVWQVLDGSSPRWMDRPITPTQGNGQIFSMVMWLFLFLCCYMTPSADDGGSTAAGLLIHQQCKASTTCRPATVYDHTFPHPSLHNIINKRQIQKKVQCFNVDIKVSYIKHWSSSSMEMLLAKIIQRKCLALAPWKT